MAKHLNQDHRHLVKNHETKTLNKFLWLHSIYFETESYATCANRIFSCCIISLLVLSRLVLSTSDLLMLNIPLELLSNESNKIEDLGLELWVGSIFPSQAAGQMYFWRHKNGNILKCFLHAQNLLKFCGNFTSNKSNKCSM